MSLYLKMIRNVIIKKPDYFHIPHSECMIDDILKPVEYYIDLRPKIDYNGLFDEKGVFLLFQEDTKRWDYYPISVFNYGLAAYQHFYNNKNEEFLEKSLNQANWALKTQEKTGKYKGCWLCGYDNKTFSLKAGWQSAMAQGLGISLLLRLWMITQNEQYLESASLALLPFHKTVDEGGVLAMYKKKYIFFEEYPSNPSSFVLNGYVSAIWGLRDYGLFLNDNTVLNLWNQSVEVLSEILPQYDLGYWSRYDLREGEINVASQFYHHYHITLLNILYKLSQFLIFKNYAQLFNQYEKNKIYYLKALSQKIVWRLKRM